MSDSRSSFEDYIDNFDRTAHGAGSQKGKDRFSALDINKMFKARGDLSKAEGAQMVLDYADKAGAEGSSMGGGSKRELDQLRGYLNDNSKEETTDIFIGNNNEQDILNTQLSVANKLIQVLRGGDLHQNGYQLEGSVGIEPFYDRFENELAGWESNLNVTIYNDILIC